MWIFGSKKKHRIQPTNINFNPLHYGQHRSFGYTPETDLTSPHKKSSIVSKIIVTAACVTIFSGLAYAVELIWGEKIRGYLANTEISAPLLCSTVTSYCGPTAVVVDFTTVTRTTSQINAVKNFESSLNRSSKGHEYYFFSITDNLEDPLKGLRTPFVNPGPVSVVTGVVDNSRIASERYNTFKKEVVETFKETITPMGAKFSPIAHAINDVSKMPTFRDAENVAIDLVSDLLEFTPEFSAYRKHHRDLNARNAALAKHLAANLGNLDGFIIRLTIIERRKHKGSQDQSLIDTWVRSLKEAGAVVLANDVKI